MPRQCVFYLRGHEEHCEVAGAVGAAPMGKDERKLMQQYFCSTAAFRECPFFRQLERSLARAHLELTLPSAA